MPDPAAQLITAVDVRRYFQTAVSNAVEHSRVSARDETVLYVANLLATFVHAERLFERTPEGVMLRPLAQLLGEAAAAGSVGERDLRLRRLGDVALFISGLYAQSLSRSLVDVDYYIALGGGAYGRLAQSAGAARGGSALPQVFAELAAQFAEFVDLLGDVGDRLQQNRCTDVLRLYEIWLCSGSRRAGSRLRELGIDPVPGRRSTH